MYPDRYGSPDTSADERTSGPGRFENDDGNYLGPGLVRSPGNELLNSMTGLMILTLAAMIGFAITITIYRLTHPGNLTATWILGYVGMLAAFSFISAILLYAMRRVVLALILSAIAFSIGYAVWHLWFA
jgi:hypothetical protein